MNSLPGKTAAGGFILLEALVALIIFMLGILGLIGMQAAFTRAQTDVKARADAAYLGSELIGRMWQDPRLATVSAYDGCGNASCTEWANKVKSRLGANSQAQVSVDSGGNVNVVITWVNQNGDTHNYQISTAITPRD